MACIRAKGAGPIARHVLFIYGEHDNIIQLRVWSDVVDEVVGRSDKLWLVDEHTGDVLYCVAGGRPEATCRLYYSRTCC